MRLSLALLFACSASTASAFAPSSIALGPSQHRRVRSVRQAVSPNNDKDDNLVHHSAGLTEQLAGTTTKTAALTASVWAASTQIASAAGPDWGLFEGKSASLLHPVMMFSLLALSVSTAILGFQWRRQRTMGDEISSLKKSLPSLGGAGSISEALAEAGAANDSNQVSVLTAALTTEQDIAALTNERKELAAAGPKDKHFSQGALLAFLGTAFAIEGPLNTYARAGKLFPGPHLYAGAGLVCLWALAYACVPAMQKGNETARTVHIGANVTGIAFFVWQVTSGIPILQKVWEKTQWP